MFLINKRKLFCLLLIFYLLFSCADLNRGKNYYSEGKYKDSYEEFIELSDKGFPLASYYVGKLIENGDIENTKTSECVKYYEKAYNQGYKSASSKLGFYYLNTNDNEKAIKWLQIAVDAGDNKARVVLYKLKLQISSAHEKQEILRKIQKLSSNDPEFMYLNGLAYELGYAGKKDLNIAMSYYLKAYRNGLVKAGLKYGNLLEKSFNTQEAENIYKEIYNKYHDITAAYRLGRIFEEKAKNLKLSYCPVTKAKTTREYYELKKEDLKVKKELFNRALFWYDKSKELLKSQYRIYKIKWYLEEKRCGEYDVIKKFLEENVAQAIKDYQTLYQYGSCSIGKKTTGSFITQEKEINNLFFGKDNETFKKGTLNYYLKTGKCYELNKLNKKKAFENYEKACFFISPEAEISLAKLIEEKNYDLSSAVYYYYSRKGDPKAMYLMASLLFKLGLNDKAVYWLKKSVEKRYFPALKDLVDYYFEKDDDKKVVTYLESVTDIYPCFVNIKLGEVYEGNYNIIPDLNKAEMYYQRALNLNCQEAYYRLSWFYFYNKGSYNIVKAKKLIQEYIFIIKEDSPKAFRLLGRIYNKLGDKENAIKYLYKASRLGYNVTTDEVKLMLTKYKKIENIFPVDSGGKALVYLAEFTSSRDLKASLCFAYKAAKNNIDRGGLLFLKLGMKINTQDYLNFLKHIKEDENFCDAYIVNKYKK